MPLRFRRKRVLLLLFLLLCVVYLLSQQLEYPVENDDHPREAPGGKSLSSFRSIREQLVDVRGRNEKKIDWHDYECMARDDARSGLGEGGEGVEPGTQERNNADFQRLYQENGFYASISDNISLHRSVKDIRHRE